MSKTIIQVRVDSRLFPQTFKVVDVVKMRGVIYLLLEVDKPTLVRGGIDMWPYQPFKVYENDQPIEDHHTHVKSFVMKGDNAVRRIFHVYDTREKK